MSKPEMTRSPTLHELADFAKACRLLRGLAAAGWHLYLDGSGGMNLMNGPSHGEGLSAAPRQDRVLERETCGATGGDW